MIGRPPSSSQAPVTPRKRLLHPDRLAAALGLSAFIDSFQSRGAARRLRPEARPPKLSLAVSSSKWHTATSAQHVRGILQVNPLPHALPHAPSNDLRRAPCHSQCHCAGSSFSSLESSWHV